MKTSITVALALFVLGVVVGLLQVWTQWFSDELFVKIELTIGALLLIAVVLGYVVNEYRSYRAIQERSDLDGK